MTPVPPPSWPRRALTAALGLWLALAQPAAATDGASPPAASPVAASPVAASPASPGTGAVPVPAAPTHRRLHLFYTGMTGGLSSAQLENNELMPLFEADAGRTFEVGGYVQDNVFRHGDYMIYTAQGPFTLSDFQAFFDAGPVTMDRVGAQPMVASDYGYVLQPVATDEPWVISWLLDALRTSGKYPDTRPTTGRRFKLTNGSGLSLSMVALTDVPPPPELLQAPARWEMVPAVSVAVQKDQRATMVMSISRPLGDGLRRASLLNSLRRGREGRQLTVDLGNVLDPGFSELSRQQREFTFLQLDHLGYDALVPAETELTLPSADWARLVAKVPMVAANLKPNSLDVAPLPPFLMKEVDGLKVALVGLVDDRVLTREGAAGPRAAWTATDPVAAAKDVMAAVSAQSPDAVVLLTNVRDDRLQQFRHIAGLTLILADFQGLPGETFTETATLAGMNRLRIATAYMIAHSSRNRVGHVVASWDVPAGRRPELAKLENVAHLVTDRLPYDESWRWQLNLTLDGYQATRRQLVLPDLRAVLKDTPGFKPAELDSGLPRVEWQLWSRVVANVLRDATGAEVAIARQAPMKHLTLGPVNQLTLEGWLEMGDRLVQTTLPGKALKALAGRNLEGKLVTFAGYDPATQKIHGYSLVDEEVYRVTTTDQVIRHALFQDVFAKRRVDERWLRHPSGWARPYPEGERPEVRDVVLSYLKALKTAHGETFDAAYMKDYAALLADGGQYVAPRWTVSLDDGQLLLNSYDNQNIQPFSQVRNTRVNTPDSFALGGKGRLAVVYDSPDLAWENRARSIYRRATLAKDGVEVTQETDDEIMLTSEFRLKALQMPLGVQKLPLLPFVNTNFTTEFTPGANATGQAKPRRAELNSVTGLILNPGFGLKELRAGAVLKNDLANPGALEPGVQAVAIYEQTVSEAWPAVVRAGVDVTHYLNTPTDTADRLGLMADFTAGLTIPVWERFNFTLSADYFLFRGKVPATDVLGTSLDIKVGLGYSLGFKPFYGVWF